MDKKTLENPDKSGHSPDGDLTPRQVQALAALLDSPSIVAVEHKTGVADRTIRRWMKNNESFQARLRDLREEALSGAANKLQCRAFAVVETLHRLILDSDTKVEPGRAALIRLALDFAFRAGAYSDLADRIVGIETSPASKTTASGQGTESRQLARADTNKPDGMPT